MQPWTELSSNTSKIEAFVEDPYFHESWTLGRMVLGDDTLIKQLKQHALILIKPEAFEFGKATELLRILEEEQFTPVYITRKVLSRNECIDLWHYQWHAASCARQITSQLLMSSSASIIVILHTNRELAMPASTYISDRKGPAVESRRHPYHIRSILNSDPCKTPRK